jgi:glycosyltransferase involved in cell wall biosynthesis
MRNKYSVLFRHLDGAIAVSHFIERQLRTLGFDGDVEIIPCGVRLEDFAFRGALQPGDEVRLLFVGRLVRRKGLDVLLRALPALAAVEPRLRLDVVGDGPEREACARLCEELHVERIVRFHGALPREAVRSRLRAAHIAVMASRTMPNGEAEGSPVFSKEALAVGLPLVATDNGGTIETIPPEDRHEIVPEENVDALVKQLTTLLARPETWEERALRGRDFVERNFAWSDLARATERVYERAASRRSA